MNATTFLEILKSRNEPLYWFGLFCFAATLFCALFIQTTQTQVLGINAWYKPLKFFCLPPFLSGQWAGIQAIWATQRR